MVWEVRLSQRNETSGKEYSTVFRSPNTPRKEENVSPRRYLLQQVSEQRKAQSPFHRGIDVLWLGWREEVIESHR